MQDQYQPNGQFKKTKVAFCVHNIAYQVGSQLCRMCHMERLLASVWTAAQRFYFTNTVTVASCLCIAVLSPMVALRKEPQDLATMHKDVMTFWQAIHSRLRHMPSEPGHCRCCCAVLLTAIAFCTQLNSTRTDTHLRYWNTPKAYSLLSQ